MTRSYYLKLNLMLPYESIDSTNSFFRIIRCDMNLSKLNISLHFYPEKGHSLLPRKRLGKQMKCINFNIKRQIVILSNIDSQVEDFDSQSSIHKS